MLLAVVAVGCNNGTSGDESFIDEDESVIVEEEAIVDEESLYDDEYATIDELYVEEDGYESGSGRFVDLGLSSGTKWCSVNEDDFYSYDMAVKKFGKMLPSGEQWKELYNQCKLRWVKGESAEETGCWCTGPNGNTIFFPALGFKFDGSISLDGCDGRFWASDYNYHGEGMEIAIDNSGWHYFFSSSDGISQSSVRLVKN